MKRIEITTQPKDIFSRFPPNVVSRDGSTGGVGGEHPSNWGPDSSWEGVLGGGNFHKNV